jgi:hypothetical protein
MFIFQIQSYPLSRLSVLPFHRECVAAVPAARVRARARVRQGCGGAGYQGEGESGQERGHRVDLAKAV